MGSSQNPTRRPRRAAPASPDPRRPRVDRDAARGPAGAGGGEERLRAACRRPPPGRARPRYELRGRRGRGRQRLFGHAERSPRGLPRGPGRRLRRLPARLPVLAGPGPPERPPPAPAMVFKDGRLFMPFGSPGGDVQQQAMLQVFLNIAVFGMPPQLAGEAPRAASRSFPDSFWPHPAFPGQLNLEARISPETAEGLAGLGHRIERWAEVDWRAGAVCGIVVRSDGTLLAGADPPRGSHAP